MRLARSPRPREAEDAAGCASGPASGVAAAVPPGPPPLACPEPIASEPVAARGRPRPKGSAQLEKAEPPAGAAAGAAAGEACPPAPPAADLSRPPTKSRTLATPVATAPLGCGACAAPLPTAPGTAPPSAAPSSASATRASSSRMPRARSARADKESPPLRGACPSRASASGLKQAARAASTLVANCRAPRSAEPTPALTRRVAPALRLAQATRASKRAARTT
mmetsp:Transcript_18129/g.60673  ORF Transcript_18129/g.60673 Transcript_18129/m.60673 type:complete len:223 (+) Transcript_18129:106-774(+)